MARKGLLSFRAVLEQPCSTGGRTGTVRPKHLPAGRTGLSNQFLGPVAQDQPGPVGQICPTSWLLLWSDSVRLNTGRTRLFEHRSSSRVRPVNAGSEIRVHNCANATPIPKTPTFLIDSGATHDVLSEDYAQTTGLMRYAISSWADENFHHHSSTNLEEKQNNWTNTPHYSASKVPSFPLVVLSWSSGVICLTESLSEDELSTGEPELVADQPTVAAAAHNLINPYA
ncbi:hypothetical protein PCASD_18846 [Puccinia coronata f. sp. avenae]|uniref:Uncharacterized protein n=1 Tax=Puccinia coronata f. sp. avenae TaxID=200324 RepID=A0A2N5SG73_9BASI|nr:hypothetical protein PCASD_18846 [Puccinia coronata f. sp. avenae]